MNPAARAARPEVEGPASRETGPLRCSEIALVGLALALLVLAVPAAAGIVDPRAHGPASPEPSHADEEWRRFRLLLDAGVGIPALPEEFKRYWAPVGGWGLGGCSGIAPTVDVVARFEFYDMPFDAASFRREHDLPASAAVSAGSASVFAGMMGLRIHAPADGLRPYLEAAIGLPDISRPGIAYVDPVKGPVEIPGAEIFALDPAYSFGVGLEWYRPETWGAYVDARLIDAPGRTEPAQAWASIRTGVSIRMPRLRR